MNYPAQGLVHAEFFFSGWLIFLSFFFSLQVKSQDAGRALEKEQGSCLGESGKTSC